MKELIHNTVEALKAGQTILYPTDTIWGIGCDSTNKEAVEKIYKIKKRDKSKSLLVLVDSEQMLNRYIKNIPEVAWDIIDYSEKPTTIIYDESSDMIVNEVKAQDGSLGVRVVKDEFCQKIIQRLKAPLVSTSANFSGEPSPKSFNDISEELKNNIEFIVNYRKNENMDNASSSIIKLSENGAVKVIRQ